MIKKFSTLLMAIGLSVGTLVAQEVKTTLSAQIYGYQKDMVYFDCMQTPLIAQEFYTNPGEEHIYSFE